jgi:hypothetical protein
MGGIIRLPDIYEMAWPPRPCMVGEPRATAEQVLAQRRRAQGDAIRDAAGEPTSQQTRMRANAVSIDPVALAPHVRLTTLDRVDYADAFRLETELAQKRTAEQWARALLEEAPEATRVMLRRGWFALGVQLGSTEDGQLVLGWPVRWRAPDNVVLGARSRLGFEAEVLVTRERSAVVVATVMQLKNPAARAVWTGFAPKHRRVLRHLLEEAGERAGGGHGHNARIAAKAIVDRLAPRASLGHGPLL